MRLRENLVEFDETLIDALKDAAARKMVDLFFWKVEDGFYVSAQLVDAVAEVFDLL